MAVAFRSASTMAFLTRTNTVFTAPTGITNGDILLIHFCIGQSGAIAATATLPTGFTVVSGLPVAVSAGSTYTINNYIWYKVASSESGNYTVTHSNHDSFGYMGAYSGSSGTPTATTNTGSGTTTTALTITTTTNNAEVIFVSQDWQSTSNTLSAPTGTTPTFTIRANFAQCTNLFVADGVLATAAATGNKTMTNNNGADPFSGYLIKLEAAAGAAVVPAMALLGVGP